MTPRPVTQAEIDQVIEVDVDVDCEDRHADDAEPEELGEESE